jgi:hypothetical protein
VRFLLAAALIASTAAGPAGAGEPAQSSAGHYVDISPVALPVVENGRIRNYIFVAVRLNLSAGVDPLSVREKEPYFRDALVRAGHRRPFTVPGEMTRVDEPQVRATVLSQAAAIVGPGVVTSVGFASVPTPQRRTGMIPSRR